MGSLALTKASPKVHSHTRALAAKIQLRNHALDFVGADRASVFDAFAGPGEMYRGAWSRAARYVGCDEEWHRDARRVFVADNRVVMRAIDLAAFNVFDFNAFGSPWEQITILAARRHLEPGERIAIVFTDGSSLKLRTGGLPHALARLCGVSPSMELANRSQSRLVNAAIVEICKRIGGRVTKQWQAGVAGRAGMQYYALGITGSDT